jgi:hypothetical protein
MIPALGAIALPAGTRISLASAEPCPVEQLVPGAVLDSGAVVTSVVELPYGAMPDAIILANDALSPGSPALPLFLSPQQWLALGDRLVQAGALANGTTIQRLPAAPPAWYALAADRPTMLIAEGVSLALPSHGELAIGFRPLAAGTELELLRAGLRPPAPVPLRVLLGTEELAAKITDSCLEVTLPEAEGAPMTVLRLLSPPGRPRGTQDLRRFGVAIRKIELDEKLLPLDDPGFGDGFHPVEGRDNATWRWTDGEATLALPPSDTPRILVIHIAPWHTQLEPA